MTHNPYHPAGGAGAVKVLRWVASRSNRADRHANTELGQYCAARMGDGFIAIRRFVDDAQLRDEVLERGLPSLDAAKSVAWADYKSRILSTLSPTPVPEPEAEGEAVAWWRYVPEWGCKKLCAKTDLGAEPLYTRPSSEAEIADLRAKLEEADAEILSTETMLADERRMRFAAETNLRRVERIVDELERQNKVNDSYASGLPKAERNTSELWLICNSHVKDRTRELRQALSLAGEEKTGASDV